MVTGATSAWGYPVKAISGQLKTMTIDNIPLTYQESLTSYPLKYNELSTLNYQTINGFGKKKNSKKKNSKRKILEKDYNFLKNKS